MIQPKTIEKPQGADFEILPADLYQVQIMDVDERETIKFGTTDEKVMQFMFKVQVVEGESKGKGLVFFTSESWFDGGKNNKPSKLYNLMKTIEGFYKDMAVTSLDAISDVEINGIVGKQIRVTAEVTDSGKNKVTGFLPIKKEIEYVEEKTDESVNPDDIPF